MCILFPHPAEWMSASCCRVLYAVAARPRHPRRQEPTGTSCWLGGCADARRIGISDLQIVGSRDRLRETGGAGQLGNTQRGRGEERHQTHHDSPCAASCWVSCGRHQRQMHADRGPWPRSRTWSPCLRWRSSSPWLQLPSLSSGRGSHWVSWLRNGRRVRSSFEQGRRLLAGIGDDPMALPTQRLLLWVLRGAGAAAVSTGTPAVLSLVPLSLSLSLSLPLLPLLSLSRLLMTVTRLGG